MVRIADDDMVEHFDLKELPRADKVAGHFDVSFGWLRFPARVIVHEHNCRCRCNERRSKHFAWMNQYCIKRAH
jgi:hypothetical protein